MNNAWMQTFVGGAMDLLNPTQNMVSWVDIAMHLSKIGRFTGATKGDPIYSVAEHSLNMANHASKEAIPYVLLHDAHEAYMGDISSPMKMAIASLGGGEAIKSIEHELDAAIYGKAGLIYPIPNAIRKEVKQLDMIALSTERRELMHMCAFDIWGDLPEAWNTQIKPCGVPIVVANAYYNALLAYLPSLKIMIN